MNLVTGIDKVTAGFPNEERLGRSSQTRRVAISTSPNITEGRSRKATGASLNHISLVYGSLMGLETQMEIAGRLNFTPVEEVAAIRKKISEIARTLNSREKSLSAKET